MKELLRQLCWLAAFPFGSKRHARTRNAGFGQADAARLRAGPSRPAPGEGPRRWLVLGYAAIGDAVFLLPALRRLRRLFPDARITFLANRSPITLELIPAAGVADEVELAECEGVDEGARRALNERLVAEGFDGVFLSLSSPAQFFRETIASATVRVGHCTRLAAPPGLGLAARAAWLGKRVLVTGEFGRRLLLNRKAWVGPGPEQAVGRNLKLIEALGGPPEEVPAGLVPVPPRARALAEEALGPAAGPPWVGVHLGAPGNPYRKIWPPARFGRLCRRLRDETGARCFLVGGAEEAPAVEAAREAARWEIPSWVGRCGLIESFALIGRCALFLSNDTGLAKAAMAMAVPTVTLWGPTDPVELGRWDRGDHLDIRLGLGCSPCVRLGMPWPLQGIHYGDCGHHRCLSSLDEDEVFAAVIGRYGALLGSAGAV